jgi:hypothetical protein
MITKFLKQMIIPIIILIGIGFYMWSEINIPAVRRINITLDNFPEKIKILHITDAHGREINDNQRLMRAIHDFKPDVAVLTGDMIDESTVDFSSALRDIRTLSSEMPVLYVPGNHERANPKGASFINSVRESGASVLLNNARMINNISICGVDDINLGFSDVSASIAVYGRCDILLSHSPAINKSIVDQNIPLVLAGHTHGGQVALPIIGALFLPDKSIPRSLIKGLVKDGDTQFYVSVGFGTSVFPLRFMNRAEINLLTVDSR